MSITKQPLKSKPVVKCAFKVNAEQVANADALSLVGCFNNWDTSAHPMKKLKNGDFKLDVNLDANQSYQFRYCSDKGDWFNEPEADAKVVVADLGAENSLLQL